MLHSFELFGITLYPFYLCALAGMIIFFALSLRRAAKTGEAGYLFPKLLVSCLAGVSGAFVYDVFFKYIETGEAVLGGISFYGGLIFGAAAFWLTAKNGGYSSKTPLEWLDTLTVPFCAFHFCGRIGCFLGGCCYGTETESALGVYFPDIPEEGVFHNGAKCFPTQLFEAAAILAIALLLATALKKHAFMNYLILYPTCRFFLEFLRGDDRGATGLGLSPSQLVSVLLLVVPAAYYLAPALRDKSSLNKGSK